MKKFIELEPTLRSRIKGRRAERISFPKMKRLRTKATRAELKRNLDAGNEVFKAKRDWEF